MKKLLWIIIVAVLAFMAIMVYSSIDTSGKPPVQTPLTQNGGTTISLLKLLGALGFVLVLLAGFAWLARNYLGPQYLQTPKEGALKIISSTPIAPKSRIVLLKAFDHILVLGVTEQQISILSEISDERVLADFEKSLSATSPTSFKRYLQNFLG